MKLMDRLCCSAESMLTPSSVRRQSGMVGWWGVLGYGSRRSILDYFLVLPREIASSAEFLVSLHIYLHSSIIASGPRRDICCEGI